MAVSKDGAAASLKLACLALNAADVPWRPSLSAGAPSPEQSEFPAIGSDGLPQDYRLTRAEREKAGRLLDDGFPLKEQERAAREGVRILDAFDGEYPPRLRHIADPPLALYVQGNPDWLSRPSVAIVGSRNASRYGIAAAEALAGQLAMHGLTVVSGFARGIDCAAHGGALRTGGGTVAVLGCGVDVDYPRGQGAIRERIAARGCLASEFPMGARPAKQNFPRRNRIISGLSLGTVVVEAMERSGALITARHAAEQGREVFAVPGSIFAPGSFGPHRLLREGAKLVDAAEDILQELKDQYVPVPMSAAGGAPAEGTMEASVARSLTTEPTHLDELSRRLAIPIGQLTAILALLEMKGCARRHPGKLFSKPG